MKFSGKQLFDEWNAEYTKATGGQKPSAAWSQEVHTAFDALAEKLNAMLEPSGVIAGPSDHQICPCCYRQFGLDQTEELKVHIRTHILSSPTYVPMERQTSRPHDEYAAQLHTRSCREKMEKGEGCSC